MIDCVVSRYKKNTDWVYNLRNINNYYIIGNNIYKIYYKYLNT